MPKRSFEEKLEYYMNKVEKLKDKHRYKRRRHDSFSSSEQGDEIGMDITVPATEPQPDPVPNIEIMLPDLDDHQASVLMESTSTQQNELQAEPEPVPFEPPLDPEILSALGEATDQGPIWGQEVHTNLSQLWQPLLKKGMAKDIKDKFLKQYTIPSNCTLLQAPKLNIEISAAVTEMVRLRDKKVETSQQQLGTGITAISRAMSLLLTSDNKIEAIKILSDGCRILCDLHHAETLARIKMITPGLAKSFLNVIQDSERDETLFGVSLPEKIKASKTIEKQGLQIKKTMQPARSNPLTQMQNIVTPRQQFQGNWMGPSRYPKSRGGRGGPKRYPTSTRRPPPITAPVPTSQTKASQSRARAPVRQ